MQPSLSKPEAGRYIAFLTRADGPGENATVSTSGKRRLRSEFLFDAIALETAQAGNVTDVAPASRPLFRVKTTAKHFQDMTGREARSGEWFLLDIVVRHGGSWVWAAVEDADSATGFEEVNGFSAAGIQYLDPGGDVGPAQDADIAKAFLLVRRTYLVAPSRPDKRPNLFRFLRRAISNAPRLFVEAIDVGQASFVCIHDGQKSYAYFDAGLPLWFNAKSMPPSPVFFPPHKQAVIVLSHWDYDHYSAIQKFENLGTLRCIAPAGELGPNAGKLAKKMGKRLWALDHGVKITIGPMKLRWATGPVDDRNNRGIIGIVKLPHQKILLTGDASYTFIKSIYWKNLTGVSIPHHASEHSHSAAHVPAPSHPAIAVTSAGHPNKYGHPSGVTISAHRGNSWNVQVTGAYPSYARGNKRF